MAHYGREEGDLGRVESPELAVLDEVRRMAVVALARDVLTDVVQQRRELEHLAVTIAELVEFGRLVEQEHRQPRDLRGMRNIGVAAPGEARDGCAPKRSRIVGPVARVV